MTTFEGKWTLVVRKPSEKVEERVRTKRTSLVKSHGGEQKVIGDALAQMVTVLREPEKHPEVEVIFLEDA